MKLRDIGVALAVGASLTITACSGSDSSPSYCDKLNSLPGGLMGAISAAAGGVASDADRVVIARASGQMKDAEKDSSMPADTRVLVGKATDILDKLAQGQNLSADDLTAFSNLGGMDDQCSHE